MCTITILTYLQDVRGGEQYLKRILFVLYTLCNPLSHAVQYFRLLLAVRKNFTGVSSEYGSAL